ncbi:MAG: hypothetical protein R8K20_11770 [Gallionellaceae bacterium]
MIIDTKTDMVYGLSIRSIDGQVFAEDGRKVVGWLYCDDCGAPVPVKLNKGGNPYYGCFECNNQHRPQSTISRTHFQNRMEKIETKGVKDDRASENTSKETEQPSKAKGCSESGTGDGTESGKPSGSVRVGFFG